ncbi:hypothetical protein [Bacillus sp. Marseille-P3661]|uniref:hypothetical protein n=1 Tax=Bacillus sp. Marseille-P3661 TaxID=1936234 RepID=UPI000C840BFB|nr:hypothetical protein [Bacillus sp. Marseille-P3661]
MQIYNQLSTAQPKMPEKPLELKRGELYKAQIKERISDSEAVLQIRGKEITATFEDKVPSENRVTVQVTGQKDQGAVVKTIAVDTGITSSPQSSSESKILQSVGISQNDSPELKSTVQMLLDKGVPVTKESVQVLKDFFEKAPGTTEAKLDTVKALANKRLEVTENHLRPIHEALHGKPLNQVLSDLAKEIDPEFEFAKKEKVTLQPDSKTGNIVSQASQSNVTQAVRTENTQSQSNDSNTLELRDAIRKSRELVQQEPDLKKAVEKIREEVVKNPKLDREMAQKIEKALSEAEKLQTIGKERLVQALKSAEEQLVKKEQQLSQTRNNQPNRVESTQIRAAKPSEVVAQVRNSVANNPNLKQSIETVKARIVNESSLSKDVLDKVERSIAETSKLLGQGRLTAGKETLVNDLNSIEQDLQVIESQKTQQLQVVRRDQASSELKQVESRPQQAQPASETVKQVKEEVQREPNLQKAVEKVRESVVNNPKIDREVAQKVEKALNEVRQLQQIGRESVGRERLAQALTQAESELKQVEQRPQQTQPSSETVKHVKEEVQREPNLQRAVEKVQNLIANNKNIDPEVARNVERLAKQADQLNQAGRDRIINLLDQIVKSLKQAETKLTNSITQNTDDSIDGLQANNSKPRQESAVRPSETLSQALKHIQKEPVLEKALEQVRKEVSSNPNLDLKTVEKINQTFNQASQLQDKGRELAARQLIINSLTELQQEFAKSETQFVDNNQKQESAQYDLNEQMQSMNLNSKDIVVTKITQKLAQATHDFRELKRDISKNLDNVQRLVETFKNIANPQAKKMLETAISKLDNAILKSEMMLFTDMKTEKQLMQASTHLADAKKLLAKAKHADAAKIVQDVKALIDKINFKPSDQRVMHFVSKESAALENRPPSQQLLTQINETARTQLNQDGSPRQMFETLRSLGLNHDSDLAKSLVFQKSDGTGPDTSDQSQQQQNLKAALTKLAQMDSAENSPKVAQHAEQALNNLTGQQLLSKSDSGNLQSMFFSLPLLLGENPENLQVFVNSQNEGEQVDWENCSLYFLLETKKLGDVGIMLTSTDRNLAITIKNDKPGFKEKMEPIAAITKAKLDEIGYNVNSISFTRMTPISNQQTSESSNQENQVTKPLRPVYTEKGMDYKI